MRRKAIAKLYPVSHMQVHRIVTRMQRAALRWAPDQEQLAVLDTVDDLLARHR
jgi:hypothetical protein